MTAEDDGDHCEQLRAELWELAEELQSHEPRRETALRQGRSMGMNVAGERLGDLLAEHEAARPDGADPLELPTSLGVQVDSRSDFEKVAERAVLISALVTMAVVFALQYPDPGAGLAGPLAGMGAGILVHTAAKLSGGIQA